MVVRVEVRQNDKASVSTGVLSFPKLSYYLDSVTKTFKKQGKKGFYFFNKINGQKIFHFHRVKVNGFQPISICVGP